MGMLRHIFKKLILLILFTAGAMRGQEERLARAKQLYDQKQFEIAAQTIDSAIAHPETSSDFMTWTLRAYIYNELAKRTDRMKPVSPYRDTVISSLKMSNSLKPDSLYLEQNRKMFRVMANTMNNIAKNFLEDSLNYDKSQSFYNKFKEYYLFYDPNEGFKTKDVEFYNAAGSTFANIFNKDNNNIQAGEIAKVTLLKVLEIQPDNASALMNIGLMYYNQAVTLSKSLDFGADFTQIDVVQENMVKLAKQAEQHIVRVYTSDQKHVKSMRALYYIYRMLNEIPKSDDFKKKLKDAGIDVEKEDKEAEQREKEKKEGGKDINPNKDK
jgi:hypothetical protein